MVGTGPAALHEPRFAGNEWAYLKECLDSTFVSSVGLFVDRFETDLAAYTGARFAVVVVNGTSALQMAYLLAGVRPGDEVLVPALTFVGTANAVSHCGAVPHFIDSEESTLGVDPSALRKHLECVAEVKDGDCVNRLTGRVIRVLSPMHTFGHPVDIDALLSVAEDYSLHVVEDAAESLGSTRGGRHTGTFGLMGTLSFNGNKTITTGGGGAILTDREDIAKRAKHLTTTAKLSHRWDYVHDEVGYNLRMPNINAALGCAQLEQLPEFLRAKRRLYQRYESAFAKVKGVTLFEEPEDCRSNYWLQTLLLDEPVADARESILASNHEAGLMCRPAWTPMHQLEPYQKCPRMEVPVAESLARRIISLPSGAHLS